MSEYDEGYTAGTAVACDEAIRICAAHIDRLNPGKQHSVRAALIDLEASLRSILISQQRRPRPHDMLRRARNLLSHPAHWRAEPSNRAACEALSVEIDQFLHQET